LGIYGIKLKIYWKLEVIVNAMTLITKLSTTNNNKKIHRQRGNAYENFNGTTDNTMTSVVVVKIYGPHSWEECHNDEVGWDLEKMVSVSRVFFLAPRLLLQRNA
jgi:hypothetical protein